MAGRSRSTFGKRQKEQKRQEKRQDKAARRDQRKQDKQSGLVGKSTDKIAYEDRFVHHTSDDDEFEPGAPS